MRPPSSTSRKMIVPTGNPSCRADAVATAASDLPSVLGSLFFFSSASRRPLNRTRNPNPAARAASRFPDHELPVAAAAKGSQHDDQDCSLFFHLVSVYLLIGASRQPAGKMRFFRRRD